MVSKFGKIAIGGTVLAIATYLWKIALIIIIILICIRLYNKYKNINRSEKWD